MPNYSYVADAHYKPYSFQEMLVPLTLYKQESDKREQEYLDYADRMDAFRQMAEDNPDSYAAQIYNNYSNDYQKAYNDYIEHGLNVGNKNDWLNLKRRYKGEIGRLEEADKVLKELQKNMRDKGSSYLWGNSNPTLDDILHNPNYVNYGIDSNELGSLGEAIGKSMSSRIYNAGDAGSTLGGYYRKWVETRGYSPESINAFIQNAGNIPELQQAAYNILKERGVYDNLSGENLRRAEQSVLNGIVRGAVYDESVKPVEDKSKMSASAAASYALQREQMARNDALNGITWVNGKPVFNPADNIDVQKAAAVAKAKNSGKNGNGSSYNMQNTSTVMVGANSGWKYKVSGDNETEGSALEDTEGARIINDSEKAKLIDNYGNITNENLRNAIGNGNINDYEIWILPANSSKLDGSGGFFLPDKKNDEDIYIAVPRKAKRDVSEFTGDVASSGYGGSGYNDIPE